MFSRFYFDVKQGLYVGDVGPVSDELVCCYCCVVRDIFFLVQTTAFVVLKRNTTCFDFTTAGTMFYTDTWCIRLVSIYILYTCTVYMYVFKDKLFFLCTSCFYVFFSCFSFFLSFVVIIRRFSEEAELDDAVHTALLTMREGFEGEMTEKNIEVRLITVFLFLFFKFFPLFFHAPEMFPSCGLSVVTARVITARLGLVQLLQQPSCSTAECGVPVDGSAASSNPGKHGRFIVVVFLLPLRKAR